MRVVAVPVWEESRPSMRASRVATIATLLLSLSVLASARTRLAERTFGVDLHGTRLVKLGESISRVAVGAPDIADVSGFPPDQILITGKKLGQTQATLWTSDEILVITIVVGYPHAVVVAALKQALPDAHNLQVSSSGNSMVVSGEVIDAADAERVTEIVRGYLPPGVPGQTTPPQVVNLVRTTGDQQVQLEVSFAEVSRTGLKQMGWNFWQRGGAGVDRSVGLINPSQHIDLATPGSHPIPKLDDALQTTMPLMNPPLGSAFGLLFSLGGNDFPFSATLSILSNNGYARVLAEPTLVALNGQEADFLAGGEFPIPLPLALGQVGIDFKKFGIQLKFLPTVVRDTIQLKLTSIVSDLDFSIGLKLQQVTVPGLTTRQNSTTVRLRDGQSFAIAGLLSDKVRSQVDKVPGLGDIPILGSLFRSTSYRREESELMVVVTAHLVRPQGRRPPLPGEETQADPRDVELFLVGNTIESKPGGRLPRATPPEESVPPKGPVGFKRE